MPGQRAMRKNGDEKNREPRNEQEQIGRLLGSADSNTLLEETNPGHGNYDESLLYLQGDRYLKGLIVDTAMADVVINRCIEKAKEQLAKEGLVWYDENGNQIREYDPLDEDDIDEGQSRWNAERERGEEIWQKLGDANDPITEKQLVAMVKVAGMNPAEWLPIIWQYFAGVHEMSRSLDAELIRLYLGQNYRFEGDGSDEAADKTKRSVLRGSA